MMKKKTKLFKHFMTVLNIIAFGAPLFILVINVCRDVFPKLFASWSVQHHGGTSDVFSNDLDYSVQKMQFNDFNDTILTTLDNFDYLNYDIQSRPNVQYLYETNEVNSVDDLVSGNAYHIQFPTFDIWTLAFENSDFLFQYDYYIEFDNYPCFRFQIDNIDGSVSELDYLSSFTYVDYHSLFPYLELFYNDYGDDYYVDYNLQIYFDEGAIKVDFESGYDEFNLDYYGVLSNANYYIFTALADVVDITDYISVCPLEYIPVSVTYPEVDITSLSEWKAYYNGDNYDTVVNQGCDTKMLLNFDFGKIFFKDTLINNSGNIAPYLLLNYMINYVINIGLFLFLPECLIILFSVLRSFTYKAIDDEAYR